MKSIELYVALTERIDLYEKKLLGALGNEIECRMGCSECCILQSVFPVEAYYILSNAGREGLIRRVSCPEAGSERCVFLSGDACSIYKYRPVICRTHGYPMIREGGIDFCPKNFTGTGNIDSGLILDLEALNRALVAINMIFLKENSDEFFNCERIRLYDVMMKACVP